MQASIPSPHRRDAGGEWNGRGRSEPQASRMQRSIARFCSSYSSLIDLAEMSRLPFPLPYPPASPRPSPSAAKPEITDYHQRRIENLLALEQRHLASHKRWEEKESNKGPAQTWPISLPSAPPVACFGLRIHPEDQRLRPAVCPGSKEAIVSLPPAAARPRPLYLDLPFLPYLSHAIRHLSGVAPTWDASV